MAFSFWGGLSDQVYCNSHPVEQEVIYWWLNILVFTPQDWEFVAIWNLKWTLAGGGGEARRKAFETHYGFTFGQRVNPISGELEDAIIIGNEDYFLGLHTWQQETGGDCEPLMYPSWP